MILPIFISLIMWPVNIYTQDIPDLDEATSFVIYKNGQNIFVDYTPFQAIMGTPDIIEEIDGGGIHLQYGSSKFWFILGYYSHEPPHLYYVEIQDDSYQVNINGVDVRVGDFAFELAEHFPKSWAARRFNWPSGDGYPLNEIVILEISEIESFTILIDPLTGLIRQIEYGMSLT